MIKGYFSFVLHSHLPWVINHGRWPHGTDWLNEAVAECYIPILNYLNRLNDEGHNPALIIGLTPILQEQLKNSIFPAELNYYLDNKIDAARKDIKEFEHTGQIQFLSTAKMWLEYYLKIKNDFNERYKKNIVAAFNKLQNNSPVEIITSAATHGYLPLLKYDRSVNAQIKLGQSVYQQNFSRPSSGIWLPECAYRPAYQWKPPAGSDQNAYQRRSIDELASQNDFRYFIIDSHLLRGGKAIGVYLARFKELQRLWDQFSREFREIEQDFVKSPHEIYLVASNPKISPVALLVRDPTTALQVWSGELGYPGEACYLDFHKKKFPGGLRYWQVTNPKIDLALKQQYDPENIDQTVIRHARHFVQLLLSISNKYHQENNRPAYICTPFDTELFGHWWFEGTKWLYYVMKFIKEEKELELASGIKALDCFAPEKVVTLPEGSWGEGGFHYIWLNQYTEWTWPRIYEAEDLFYKLLDQHLKDKDLRLKRLLKQLARELLLLQASDWQFLISTLSARDYAELRFSYHYNNFKQIAEIITARRFDKNSLNYLDNIEDQDCCFQDLDLEIFN